MSEEDVQDRENAEIQKDNLEDELVDAQRRAEVAEAQLQVNNETIRYYKARSQEAECKLESRNTKLRQVREIATKYKREGEQLEGQNKTCCFDRLISDLTLLDSPVDTESELSEKTIKRIDTALEQVENGEIKSCDSVEDLIKELDTESEGDKCIYCEEEIPKGAVTCETCVSSTPMELHPDTATLKEVEEISKTLKHGHSCRSQAYCPAELKQTCNCGLSDLLAIIKKGKSDV